MYVCVYTYYEFVNHYMHKVFQKIFQAERTSFLKTLKRKTNKISFLSVDSSDARFIVTMPKIKDQLKSQWPSQAGTNKSSHVFFPNN